MAGKIDVLPPVVELGGRAWQLKMTHSVLQRFSAVARCNLGQVEQLLGRYDMMTLMLWLMITASDPEIKRSDLDGWLDEMPPFQALALVTDNVGAALKAAFEVPVPDEDEAAAEGTEESGPDPIGS